MENSERNIKIHLILEGLEEETFFTIIRDSKIKCKEIDLTFKNACGASNIAKHYQSSISLDYDLVLCVFDGDYKVFEDGSAYSNVIKDLERVVGSEENAKAISLISNPNILLWILLGVDRYENITEIKPNKSVNTNLINKYFPKIGKSFCKGNNGGKTYNAEHWQLQEIQFHFTNNPECIDNLISNINEVPTNIKDTNVSSNLGDFLKALGSIDKIKKYIIEKDIFKEE